MNYSDLLETAPQEVAPQGPAEISTFPTPENEEARLSALHWLRILDTPQDERFDRIVRLAVAHFGTPMARLTFVDRTRTWYKSCVGPAAVEGPRNIALCAHTIMSDEVLVSRDPRFRDSPQVVDGPKLRFYAASPITLKDGMRVGSLCLIDVVPRESFSDQERVFLADLAQIVVHELELHRLITARENRLVDTEQHLAVARSAKDRFMGIVGHELKTPLTHIMGFGKLLADQQLGSLGSDKYFGFARNLCRSAEHLEGLVNRVLSYTSAEAGELRLSETVAGTEAIMEKCLELVRARGASKQVDVRVTMAKEAPAGVFADEVQIVEALVQVLDNAISFSPQGACVDLHACCTQEGGLCLRVLDRGPGLEPARIDDVMSAFTQGDESLSRAHDGIGLGLAVTRAIVDLHGGVTSLTNRPAGGTLVEIALPANRNRTHPLGSTVAE